MALRLALARFSSALLVCCSLTLSTAQEPAQPTKLSAKALTRDQVAVYQAFLASYQAGSKHALNVANVTDPFQPDKDDFQGCKRPFRETVVQLKYISSPTSFLRKSSTWWIQLITKWPV
jgi:hypothetical protein